MIMRTMDKWFCAALTPTHTLRSPHTNTHIAQPSHQHRHCYRNFKIILKYIISLQNIRTLFMYLSMFVVWLSGLVKLYTI